jgi:hypothetical protein
LIINKGRAWLAVPGSNGVNHPAHACLDVEGGIRPTHVGSVLVQKTLADQLWWSLNRERLGGG